MIQTMEQTVARMKIEIAADVDAGHTPANVRSFSELHDYRDANCYGGLCEDELADQLIAHFGGRDKDEGMPQAFLDFVNGAQGTIDQWLKEGGLIAALNQDSMKFDWRARHADLLRKHKRLLQIANDLASTTKSTVDEAKVKLREFRWSAPQ